jgi:hypothetical protein
MRPVLFSRAKERKHNCTSNKKGGCSYHQSGRKGSNASPITEGIGASSRCRETIMPLHMTSEAIFCSLSFFLSFFLSCVIKDKINK